jgi:chemotaxis protein methyltransferase CheR
LRKLDIESFSDYADYIFSPAGEKAEMISMVDLITTNKTDFFREADHFEYLLHTVLPHMSDSNQSGTKNICNLWSCGCSSGEEPYTLAMVLSEFAEPIPSFKYHIKATDVSSEVLSKARGAVYTESDVEPVPMQLRHKYLLRNKDSSNPLIKIKPEIRSNIQFEHLNLMDEQYSIPRTMDIIFFRNVAIYFTKSTQEEIINKICRHLKPEGYLFIGHSESLFNMDVPVKQVGSTVYRRI